MVSALKNARISRVEIFTACALGQLHCARDAGQSSSQPHPFALEGEGDIEVAELSGLNLYAIASRVGAEFARFLPSQAIYTVSRERSHSPEVEGCHI